MMDAIKQKQSSLTRREASKDKDKDKDREAEGSPAGAEASKDGAAAGEDKAKRFEGEGVVFKGKLIGSELVLESRGDKMCQNSFQRLKAMIRGTNSHKRRVVLKISYDGVKVYDEKTDELLHHHEVSQISYIAGDDTDTRTFGYICDMSNNAHQFISFKTMGPASNLMSAMSALFEAVLERKNKKPESGEALEAGESADGKLLDSSAILDTLISTEAGKRQSPPAAKARENSLASDLIGGDSGILDIDISINSDNNSSSQHIQQQKLFGLPAANSSGGWPAGGQPIPGAKSAAAAAASTNKNVYSSSNPSSEADQLFGLPTGALGSSPSAAILVRGAPTELAQPAGGQDRYAVFNEIDKYASIFESSLPPTKPSLQAASANSAFSQSFSPRYSSARPAGQQQHQFHQEHQLGLGSAANAHWNPPVMMPHSSSVGGSMGFMTRQASFPSGPTAAFQPGTSYGGPGSGFPPHQTHLQPQFHGQAPFQSGFPMGPQQPHQAHQAHHSYQHQQQHQQRAGSNMNLSQPGPQDVFAPAGQVGVWNVGGPPQVEPAANPVQPASGPFNLTNPFDNDFFA